MTAPMLRLAPNLTLPLSAVTEPIAIVGIRGSGKTNTGTVLAEELLERGQQVVVVDPTDVWWGLKSSADGTAAGYPVVILGGRHQDLPLTAGDGVTIADFVVEQRASVVCSLRHFESKRDQRRFVTDFARRLYYRKGQEGNETPLMVIFDEASLFVPQRVMGEDAQMVGAIQQLVRQGRSSGFGVTLIDQRPASINKDVLTQLELLVAHRVTSPQDRKALEAWIDQHDTEGHRDEFLATLSSLPRGEAWFWSPGWLDVFARVAVRPRRTFDSSRTPKPGERVAAPTHVAAVDLDALKAKLAATIEKAQADDPATLKKRIAELERQIRKAAKGGIERIVETPVVDQAALDRAAATAAKEVSDAYRKTLRDVDARITKLGRATILNAPLELAELSTIVGDALDAAGMASHYKAVSVPAAPKARPAAAPVPTSIADGQFTGPQHRMLVALAQFAELGLTSVSKGNVAAFSGQSSKSSGFRNNLSVLATAGAIQRLGGDQLSLTPSGRAAAGDVKAPASLEALHDAWRAQLTGPQRLMLSLLVEAHPKSIDRDQLARSSGQSPASSGYRNNLSVLSSLGLIVRETGGRIRASALLFPEGLF